MPFWSPFKTENKNDSNRSSYSPQPQSIPVSLRIDPNTGLLNTKLHPSSSVQPEELTNSSGTVHKWSTINKKLHKNKNIVEIASTLNQLYHNPLYSVYQPNMIIIIFTKLYADLNNIQSDFYQEQLLLWGIRLDLVIASATSKKELLNPWINWKNVIIDLSTIWMKLQNFCEKKPLDIIIHTLNDVYEHPIFVDFRSDMIGIVFERLYANKKAFKTNFYQEILMQWGKRLDSFICEVNSEKLKAWKNWKNDIVLWSKFKDSCNGKSITEISSNLNGIYQNPLFVAFKSEITLLAFEKLFNDTQTNAELYQEQLQRWEIRITLTELDDIYTDSTFSNIKPNIIKLAFKKLTEMDKSSKLYLTQIDIWGKRFDLIDKSSEYYQTQLIEWEHWKEELDASISTLKN